MIPMTTCKMKTIMMKARNCKYRKYRHERCVWQQMFPLCKILHKKNIFRWRGEPQGSLDRPLSQ